MKVLSVVASFYLLLASNAYAKDAAQHKPNHLGYSTSISSQVLGENREISVYLPESYQNTNRSYPVLYVVDGQRYFLQGVAYQQALLFQDKVPEFIVVGINTEPRKRRELLGKQSASFIEFFDNELLPYIDANLRTNGINMYFGWEMAGGFALDLLVENNKLFDAYFLASSTHFVDQRLEKVRQYLRDNKDAHDTYLYYSLGSREAWSVESHLKLQSLFENSAVSADYWHYELSEFDDHYTTPFNAINKGLSWFFADYSPKRFYSLQEFNDFGGLSALKRHYKQRAKRFLVSDEIHADTKHYLLNQAVNENDYQAFIELNQAFKGFISHRYDRAIWFEKYSGLHTEHKKYDAALNVLELGLVKLTELKKQHELAAIYAAKADVYLVQNEIAKAKESLLKAIKAAEANSKESIEEYKQKLANIE